MPVNRNALIRYRTIDNCLRNRYRRWSLEDLIDACSDALYEFEGIRKGISKRTIQMDIQLMRSEKLGYNAPIVVYDNKYYKYDDPDYSITNIPLTEQDLMKMAEAVEVLRQFKQFSHFSKMSEMVSKLESHVMAVKHKSLPIIDFEKNEGLKGLEYLDAIYQAIIRKQILRINYKSFKAKNTSRVVFYPYLLKEYRNRWFVFGVRKHGQVLQNLALDRIYKISVLDDEPYVENSFFNPESFFEDVIGVTKSLSSLPETVRFVANSQNAPYINTKPIHKSQKAIDVYENGNVLFELNVVVNFELMRDFFAYADGVTIVQPKHLADYLANKHKWAYENYKQNAEEKTEG